MKLVYPGERPRFMVAAVLSIAFWVLLIIGTLGIALIWLLIFYVAYLFAQSAFISYLRGTGAKLSQRQFPDLHRRVHAAAGRLGVSEVPDVYVLHADGLFNALATKFLGRHYIVLFSSVIDALEQHPGAIDFYIGHELGHIHRGHLAWGPILVPASFLPLLGAALSRANEYTCDRYGFAACETAADARLGVAALAVGHSRYKDLDLAAYAEQSRETGGFWMSYHELVGSYPWLTKRVAEIEALAEDGRTRHPTRNAFAYFLALCTPHVRSGGAGGLLVLVAIIGIMAAIAIPAYQDYIARAALMQAVSAAEPIEQTLEVYVAEKHRWPVSLAEAGVIDSEVGSIGHKAHLGLDPRGALRLSFSSAPLKDAQLLMVPQVEEGQIVGWECQPMDVPAKLIPPTCR